MSVRDAWRAGADWRHRLGAGTVATRMSSPTSSPSERRDPAPLLTARGLTVRHGDLLAVADVDLDLHAGEVTALMGRNGAGKSTLLWTMQGSQKRAGGTITVAGSDPARLSADERRAHVGLLPQTASDLLYLERVADECAAADREASAAPGSCRDMLDRLAPGIDPYAHPRDLSEGQRLALVLAVQLTASPRVMLLDEPTRGLDYDAKAALATIDNGAGI